MPSSLRAYCSRMAGSALLGVGEAADHTRGAVQLRFAHRCDHVRAAASAHSLLSRPILCSAAPSSAEQPHLLLCHSVRIVLMRREGCCWQQLPSGHCSFRKQLSEAAFARYDVHRRPAPSAQLPVRLAGCLVYFCLLLLPERYGRILFQSAHRRCFTPTGGPCSQAKTWAQ